MRVLSQRAFFDSNDNFAFAASSWKFNIFPLSPLSALRSALWRSFVSVCHVHVPVRSHFYLTFGLGNVCVCVRVFFVRFAFYTLIFKFECGKTASLSRSGLFSLSLVSLIRALGFSCKRWKIAARSCTQPHASQRQLLHFLRQKRKAWKIISPWTNWTSIAYLPFKLFMT